MPPKTQKEMVNEIYDLIVGAPGEPGMAETIRNHCSWMKDHDAKHGRITKIVWTAVTTAVTSAIAASVAWARSLT